MKYDTPNSEGFYWAKLVHPHLEPEGEDWAMNEYEPVLVFDNNGTGEDEFRVFVMGIEPTQYLDAFVWGPSIPHFKP